MDPQADVGLKVKPHLFFWLVCPGQTKFLHICGTSSLGCRRPLRFRDHGALGDAHLDLPRLRVGGGEDPAGAAGDRAGETPHRSLGPHMGHVFGGSPRMASVFPVGFSLHNPAKGYLLQTNDMLFSFFFLRGGLNIPCWPIRGEFPLARMTFCLAWNYREACGIKGVHSLFTPFLLCRLKMITPFQKVKHGTLQEGFRSESGGSWAFQNFQAGQSKVSCVLWLCHIFRSCWKTILSAWVVSDRCLLLPDGGFARSNNSSPF